MFIGTTTGIVAALQKESVRLTGPSKEEFDKALPHLTSLVQLNYNQNAGSPGPVLKLTANGHSYAQSDGTGYGNCSVQLEHLGGILV